jgi:hypothetical protein
VRRREELLRVVAPPGPPSSTCAAVAAESRPEALATVPPKPVQSTVARAS